MNEPKLPPAVDAMNTGLSMMQSAGVTPIFFIGKTKEMGQIISSFNIAATNDLTERELLTSLQKFCESRLKEIPA